LLELLPEPPLEWFPLERRLELLLELLELLLELPIMLLLELLLLLATQGGTFSHAIGISPVHFKGSSSEDQIVICSTSPKFAGISWYVTKSYPGRR
jgi:hypothetical protein